MLRPFEATRRTLLLGVGATAMAFMASAAPVAAESVETIYPTPPTTFAIPHYVAQDKGYFKEQGLTVVDTHLLGDANAFRALVSGAGDVVLVGPSTTMLGIQKGAKVRVFASWQPRVDYQMITRADGPKMLGPELVGLKFASGGGISMLNHMTAMILRKNGLDSTKNQHVPIGGHSDRLAAVIAGKAQLSMVNTLTATRAGKQINIVTPVAKELGGIGYVYLAARQSTLNDPERRAALKKYVKGFIQGARYAIKDPDYAAASLVKRAPENPLALVKQVVRALNAIPVWGVNGGIPNEVTEFTAKTYLEYKVIKKPMAIDDILYKSIVSEVIAELGKWNG
ncbi:MAG: ABC transporter substrate-binding protein [Proteobacteria bacterium]|nr:ABC transporter substrate-binding protein [Pseudomonadota bacterium]